MSPGVGRLSNQAQALLDEARDGFKASVGYPGITLDVRVAALTRVTLEQDDLGRATLLTYEDGIEPGSSGVCDLGFGPRALSFPEVRLIAGWASHVCAIHELTASAEALAKSNALTSAAAAARTALEMSARLVECRQRLHDRSFGESRPERLACAADWLYGPGETLTGSLLDACAAACEDARSELRSGFENMYPRLCAITHPGDPEGMSAEAMRVAVLTACAAAMGAVTSQRERLAAFLGPAARWNGGPSNPDGALVVLQHPADPMTVVPAKPERRFVDHVLSRVALDVDPVLVTEPGFRALDAYSSESLAATHTVARWSELAGWAIAMINQKRTATGAVLTRFAWEHALAAARMTEDARSGSPRSEPWSPSQKKGWRLGPKSRAKIDALIAGSEVWTFADPDGTSVTAGEALAADLIDALNRWTHPEFVSRTAYIQLFKDRGDGVGVRVPLANGEFGDRNVLRVPGEPSLINIEIGADGQQIEVAHPGLPRHPANPFTTTTMPTVALVLLLEAAVRMLDVPR